MRKVYFLIPDVILLQKSAFNFYNLQRSERLIKGELICQKYADCIPMFTGIKLIHEDKNKFKIASINYTNFWIQFIILLNSTYMPFFFMI